VPGTAAAVPVFYIGLKNWFEKPRFLDKTPQNFR